MFYMPLCQQTLEVFLETSKLAQYLKIHILVFRTSPDCADCGCISRGIRADSNGRTWPKACVYDLIHDFNLFVVKKSIIENQLNTQLCTRYRFVGDKSDN